MRKRRYWRTFLYCLLRRKMSDRALAAAALNLLCLNAISIIFEPRTIAALRSVSGSVVSLLWLSASRPSSKEAAHSSGFWTSAKVSA